MNTTNFDVARNRALFIDSILRSLNKATVRDAVEKGAQLRCVSESANTIVTVNVTRG